MGKGRTALQYDVMEKPRTSTELLTDAFLRKPYQYTSAETKDNTQQDMHAEDYKKTPRFWG